MQPDTKGPHNELPFRGYDEHIKKPLEDTDPQSLNRIKRLFIDAPANVTNRPFAHLIIKLCGKRFDERLAQKHWRSILSHKSEMEAKLGRRVTVQTATVDYFSSTPDDYHSQTHKSYRDLEPIRNARSNQEWLHRIYTPSYFLERLREEIQRANRYNHALSAILLDIDHFHEINEQFSYKIGDEILTLVLKILKKTIRNVDIIARYAGDRFLIILPNTNTREATELAGRIRQIVAARTARLPTLTKGITLTLAVGSTDGKTAAIDFAKRLENRLEHGKHQQRDQVYSLQD